MSPRQQTQSATASHASRRANWQHPDALVWLAPLIIVLIVLLSSPNFDSSTLVRNSPLGSDFLQDWIGSTIITSPERHLLYDTDFAQSLQHDPAVIGFSWPDNQYYPMVYPPFFYSMLRPLSALPYQTALWCWMLLIGIGIGATISIIKKFESTKTFWPVFLAVSLFFPPLLMSINMAHKSVFLLLFFTGAFVNLQRQRHFTAGMIFGLIAFKPHLVVLLTVAMLIKRQWNFVLGVAVTISVLLISTLACGLDLCWDYFQQVIAAEAYTSNAGYRLHDAVNLNAVMQLLVGGASWVTQWLTGVTSLIVMGAVILAWRGPLQTSSNRFSIQFSILMFAIPLLSPHFYIYDLTIMLLPFLLIVVANSGKSGETSRRYPRLQGISSLSFSCIAAFLLVSGFFATIAAATGVQVSAVLLIVLIGTSLVQLSCEMREPSSIGI